MLTLSIFDRHHSKNERRKTCASPGAHKICMRLDLFLQDPSLSMMLVGPLKPIFFQFFFVLAKVLDYYDVYTC
jgi:hypothetical protein